MVRELDNEIVEWRQQCWAPSARRAYASHERSYRQFCSLIGFDPVPASVTTVARYIVFLSSTKTVGTVQQYINIIRLLHLESGSQNPMQDDWLITSLLKGVKRIKGFGPSQEQGTYFA